MAWKAAPRAGRRRQGPPGSSPRAAAPCESGGVESKALKMRAGVHLVELPLVDLGVDLAGLGVAVRREVRSAEYKDADGPRHPARPSLEPPPQPQGRPASPPGYRSNGDGASNCASPSVTVSRLSIAAD